MEIPCQASYEEGVQTNCTGDFITLGSAQAVKQWVPATVRDSRKEK